MKELLLVINEDRFFLSHRVRVAEEAARNGWDVILVTKDTGCKGKITDMGFKFIDLPVNPTGMKLSDERKTLKFLYRLYKKHPDAIIHHVGLKNMLWGGIASRFTRTRGVVYAVSGLGTLFGENRSAMVTRILLKALKFAMNKRNVAIIFQNHDDEAMFIENGVVKPEKINFIKGSGVDLDEYRFSEIPLSEPLIIIFTARMLKEKGLEDVVAAAELMRSEYEGKIEFWLCGGLSDNPSAIKEDELNALVDGKYIKWLGHREDVPELLKKSAVICYPSYYREGVPKSLIEASAVGRPIVTTDSVGCRDTVEDGVNGFLVAPHNPAQIAEKLRKLIDDPGLMKKMGKASREIAERDYDVNAVARRHIEIYEKLFGL